MINASGCAGCHLGTSKKDLSDAASVMPPAEKKIRNAARNMIARYGEGALTEINQRIAELGDKRQADTQELWRKIGEQVEFLLSTSDDGKKH